MIGREAERAEVCAEVVVGIKHGTEETNMGSALEVSKEAVGPATILTRRAT